MDKPPRCALAPSFERHASPEPLRTPIATYLQGMRQAECSLRQRSGRARCTDEREYATLRPTTLETASRADLPQGIQRFCTPDLLDEQEIEPTRWRG